MLSASVVQLHDELAVLQKCIEPLLRRHASHGVEQGGFGLACQSGFHAWILAPARDCVWSGLTQWELSERAAV